MRTDPPFTWDDPGRRLVAALQRNARATNRRLAEIIGLAPSSTLQRVRDLEAAGVVRSYRAEVDLAALGRPVQAMVFVRLSPSDGPTIDRFLEVVRAMPEVVSVTLVSGVEDAIVHLAVRDVEHLRSTVLDRISTIDAVVDERTSLVFDHLRAEVIEPL